MTLLDLCSYLGLGAVGAVTVNLLLGMLMSLRYSPVRHWRHLHINLFALHQWTAYIAVFFALSHPVVLLFLHTPLFWMAGCIMARSLVSSAEAEPRRSRSPLSHRAGGGLFFAENADWPAIVAWSALSVFPSAVLLFLHSILTDPNLKGGHPDLLDGGKVFIEISLLISVAATGIRIRLRGRGFRRE
jgi:hypothetical protein